MLAKASSRSPLAWWAGSKLTCSARLCNSCRHTCQCIVRSHNSFNWQCCCMQLMSASNPVFIIDNHMSSMSTWSHCQETQHWQKIERQCGEKFDEGSVVQCDVVALLSTKAGHIPAGTTAASSDRCCMHASIVMQCPFSTC